MHQSFFNEFQVWVCAGVLVCILLAIIISNSVEKYRSELENLGNHPVQQRKAQELANRILVGHYTAHFLGIGSILTFCGTAVLTIVL